LNKKENGYIELMEYHKAEEAKHKKLAGVPEHEDNSIRKSLIR